MPTESEEYKKQLSLLAQQFPCKSVIGIKDAAQSCGICVKTALKQINSPTPFPAKKLGRNWMVSLSNLAAYLAKR